MSEPKVEVREEQPYISIPIEVAMKEWGKANALVPEVFNWLATHGLEIGGPLFYRYWTIGGMSEAFRLEVGIPVKDAVSGDGRIIAGAIPGGRYATLVHHGHPDGLTRSMEKLERWITEQQLTVKKAREGDKDVWEGRFEYYLTDPAVQPDPSQWYIKLDYLLED